MKSTRIPLYDAIDRLQTENSKLKEVLSDALEYVECCITGKNYRCAVGRIPEEYCRACQIRDRGYFLLKEVGDEWRRVEAYRAS